MWTSLVSRPGGDVGRARLRRRGVEGVYCYKFAAPRAAWPKPACSALLFPVADKARPPQVASSAHPTEEHKAVWLQIGAALGRTRGNHNDGEFDGRLHAESDQGRG